jgi:hypothetical protein
VSRSIWKSFINRPKTRASAQAVPVIRQMAEILSKYRISMGNPKDGVIYYGTTYAVSNVFFRYASSPKLTASLPSCQQNEI